MRTIKVLHLSKTSTGAIWALRQMKELVKLGVEVHVAMPTDGNLVSEYINAGITIHELNYSLFHSVTSCLNLRKIVDRVNPDIIHSHFVLTTLIMRMALCSDSRPRLFQVPGPLHLENTFFRNLDLKTAQKNDYWVGTCKWTNERYKKSGVSANRLFLSYYGTDMVGTKSSGKNKIRTELGLPEEAVLIGMVAYMYAPKRYLGQKRGLKGHEDFIDAISIVSRDYPNVYGVCIGGAWANAVKYENIVKEYAYKKTDHVHFLGTRKDVVDLYNDLYCVVHPSLSENLGGAGESLKLGVPTIATQVGGFPDIVIHGKTGLLVPPQKPDVLANTLIDVLNGRFDMHKMSKEGALLVCEMLDVKNTAFSMYEIYNKILS